MGDREVVTLTQPEQQDAFGDAKDAIINDHEDGCVDGRTYNGDLTDGEIVRLLSEAYTGSLDWDE